MVGWGSNTDSGFGDDGPSSPFLVSKYSPPGHRWRVSRRQMAWFVFVTALFAISFTVYFGATESANFAYRVGWAGTAGTLTEVNCAVIGSGKGAYTACAGQYTSDDGNIVASDAQVEGYTALVAGRSYPARLHPDGVTVSVSNQGSVDDGLAGLLLCVAVLELAAGHVVIVLTRRRQDPGAVRPDRLPPVVVTTIAVVLGLAALMFWIIANVAH
jgi:hypothetical protein